MIFKFLLLCTRLLRILVTIIGMIIVAIGDVSVEGYSGKEVVNLFKSISKPTSITFRDPYLFASRLDSSTLALISDNGNNDTITPTVKSGATTVGVMMNTNQNVIETEINYINNEVLSVQRTNLGSFTPTQQHAKIGDVIEIEYSLQVDKSNSNDPMKGACTFIALLVKLLFVVFWLLSVLIYAYKLAILCNGYTFVRLVCTCLQQ